MLLAFLLGKSQPGRRVVRLRSAVLGFFRAYVYKKMTWFTLYSCIEVTDSERLPVQFGLYVNASIAGLISSFARKPLRVGTQEATKVVFSFYLRVRPSIVQLVPGGVILKMVLLLL